VGLRREHRQEHDLDVQPQRPIVDIEQVVLEPRQHLLIVGDLAAMTVNLRPAGDARLDVVAAGIA
jgi:hypothetical protein